MTKTTNYQLPKWEKTDRIQMKDFNDMTATLDAPRRGAGGEKPCRLRCLHRRRHSLPHH